MTKKFAFCVAVALWMVPIQGSAQNGQTENVDEMIVAALRLREQGQDDQALELLRRAHQLGPSGRTLAQMGLAEQALGFWVEAGTHLSEALASGDEWVERNRRTLQTALDTTSARLGRLELRGGVDGAEVWINGAQVGVFPLSAPIPVLAGSVDLEVRAQGYATVTRTVIVAAGNLGREVISMVPIRVSTGNDQEPSRVSTTSTSSEPSNRRRNGWIITGVSAPVLVAGFGIFIWNQGRNIETWEGCEWDPDCPKDNTAQIGAASLVITGLGLAGTVTGIVLALTAPSNEQDADEPSDAEKSRAWLRFGPGSIGIDGVF